RSEVLRGDSKGIVSGSGERQVKVWDAETDQGARTYWGPSGGLALSSDGKCVVSGGRDATVKVWDAETGQEVRTLGMHTKEVTSVARSADGKRDVRGGREGGGRGG